MRNERYDDPITAVDTCDRSLAEYSDLLQTDFQAMSGARILDIGSGAQARFATEAAQHDVEVVSLNPNWRHIVRDTAAAKAEPTALNVGDWQPVTPVVAGTSASLPFQPAVFDGVTALYGVPVCLPSRNFQRPMFEEIARVLKPAGHLWMAPIANLQNKDSHWLLRKHFRLSTMYTPEQEPEHVTLPLPASLLRATT